MPTNGRRADRLVLRALGVETEMRMPFAGLHQLATHTPVTLIVDDAQWLDAATLDVLGFLARRLGADPVALVISARTGFD
jgi:hypothetical protein